MGIKHDPIIIVVTGISRRSPYAMCVAFYFICLYLPQRRRVSTNTPQKQSPQIRHRPSRERKQFRVRADERGKRCGVLKIWI